MKIPITQAIRFLKQKKVDFEPHLFEYVEKGGAKHSAEVLGVEEHKVIKTLVFETSDRDFLIVLQHGDREVSEKNLARHLNVKSVSPADEKKANNLTGYQFGGTSPFGIRQNLPIYAEKTIFNLDNIYINGGKRGFLVEIEAEILKDILNVEEIEVSQ